MKKILVGCSIGKLDVINMAGLKLTVHTGNLERILSTIPKAANKAELIVANEVLIDTEKYVPALTLSMANRTQISKNDDEDKRLYERAKKITDQEIRAGKAVVVYPGPYAAFLYYGKLMIDPATGSSWAPTGAKKIVSEKNLQYSHVPHRNATSHWLESSKAENLEHWLESAKDAIKSEIKK